MGVGVEVALAEFDEASERLQAIHRPDHRLAGQRVQHDVDAFASASQHGSRRRRQACASCRTRSAPRWRSRARFSSLPAVAMTLAPQCWAICNAARPTAPAPPWISTVSPRAEAREVDQRIVGRQEGDGHRRRCLECQVLRQPADGECRRHDVAGKGPRDECDHAVADREVLDLRSDDAHRAGTFHTEARSRQ